MDGLLGFFRPEISACRHKVVVVEMPDERRPSVVQHPLNHARGGVFVPRISFEHGALAVVSHGLRLALVIIEGRRLSVAPGQTIIKNVDCGEALAARVIIPNFIDGPEMLFGDESLQRLPSWNGRPWACFCIVSISAASICIR